MLTYKPLMARQTEDDLEYMIGFTREELQALVKYIAYLAGNFIPPDNFDYDHCFSAVEKLKEVALATH